MIEILSKRKIEKLKNVVSTQCLDCGLKNFRFACIANRKVNDRVIGFEGQGETESFSVLDLLNNCWKVLSLEEQEQIKEILNEPEEVE